jgi:predicted peroxiredoxin
MTERGRLLVHLTCGVENPTRAALALLVAATAAKEGHPVDVFIAGDGVSLLRPSTIAAVVGIGTGSVAEHLEALHVAGAGLWASGQSSAARGILPDDLYAVGFTASPPSKLVELVMTVDQVLTY